MKKILKEWMKYKERFVIKSFVNETNGQTQHLVIDGGVPTIEGFLDYLVYKDLASKTTKKPSPVKEKANDKT